MIVAVVGPTASGKSELAVALARAASASLGVRGAQIVSADAMQLYRGMDIGTAKLRPEERGGIAHHEIDVLDVTQEASVARYQREARADFARIQRDGDVPILVGGSGLYVRAALDVMQFPGTDPAVRAELEAWARVYGADALHARLARVDPAAAARIDPRNVRRLVRALEVIRITGHPFRAQLPKRSYASPAVQIGIAWPLEDLDRRIGRRTRRMFESGLVQETRGLLARGLRQGRTASRATGYAEAIACIEGRTSPADAEQRVERATRRLARRQRSWFGADPRIHWLDPHASTPLVEQALRAIS